MRGEIPIQLCACGCGKPLDRPRYLRGHRAGRSWYTVEDRGFQTPCWISTARSLTPNGYARLRRSTNGKVRNVLAHREMYEQTIGPIPEGMTLDHLCEQPLCINPTHLQPVTLAENIRRQARTRLTPDAVRAIREMPRGEMPLQTLADLYGVKLDTIRQVRSRNRRKNMWRGIASDAPTQRHLTDEEIAEIRAAPKRVIPARVLAERYGVSVSLITKLRGRAGRYGRGVK